MWLDGKRKMGLLAKGKRAGFSYRRDVYVAFRIQKTRKTRAYNMYTYRKPVRTVTGTIGAAG